MPADQPDGVGMTFLDEALPEYQVSERHQTVVQAPVDAVFRAVLDADLARSPIVRTLLTLRGLAGGRAGALRTMSYKTIGQAGFVELANDPPNELLVGLVGQFWKPRGSIRRVTADEFRTFAEPGFARTAWNFTTRPLDRDRTLLMTETRILCLDAASLRSFRRYWLVIGPFSGWIRREMLRTIKQHAERIEKTG